MIQKSPPPEMLDALGYAVRREYKDASQLEIDWDGHKLVASSTQGNELNVITVEATATAGAFRVNSTRGNGPVVVRVASPNNDVGSDRLTRAAILWVVEFTTARLRARTSRKSAPPRPSLARLARFADYWPMGLRKEIRASAADYERDIARIHGEGRYGVAYYNKILAWLAAWGCVLRSPLNWLRNFIVKGFTSP